MTLSLLPLALLFIMFSVGLALEVDDFRRVATAPRAVALGLVSQLVLLPLIAFALAALFALEPYLAVGLIVLAASPGGITSNLLTCLAGGDGALSVSLTAITSLVGVVSVPIVVNLGLMVFAEAPLGGEFPVGSMIIGVLVISTLPLLSGMVLRHHRRLWALRIEPLARRVATGLFVLIVLATFIGQWGSIDEHFAEAGPAVVALNIATMGAAMLGARLLHLSRREGIALGLECGLQNAAMGIFVAGTLLNNEAMMIPSVIYALVMNVSAALFILFHREPASAVLVSR